MKDPLDYETPDSPAARRGPFFPTRREALSMGQMILVLALVFLIDELSGWSWPVMVLVAVALVLLTQLALRAVFGPNR